MNIICTGGGGFIGSNLVESLLDKGHTVYVVDNFSTGSMDNLYASNRKDGCHLIRCDINDLNHWVITQFRERLKECDAIVHLAALPRVQLSIDDPIRTHEANVNGTLNVLEFARKLGISRVIYASSSSIYGDQKDLPLQEWFVANPLNPYAMQKYLGELYCRMYTKVYGLNTIALRFFNVYGKNMALNGAYKLVFMNWIESIKKGEKMKIYGDGSQTRDFTHVSDVVSAIEGALGERSHDKPFNMVLNVGAGKETSVLELAKMFGYPYEHIEARAHEEQRKVADLSRTCGLLSWKPKVTIEEGVKQLKEEYGI